MTKVYAVALSIAAGMAIAAPISAQQPVSARVEMAPATTVNLTAGESIRLTAVAYDSAGRRVDVPIRFFSSNRRALLVSREGVVIAQLGGTYRVVAMARDAGRARASVTVNVEGAPIAEVAVQVPVGRMIVGTSVRAEAKVTDRAGLMRDDVEVRWSSGVPRVATIDRYGQITALSEGRVTIIASAGGVTGEYRSEVVANPIRTFTLSASADSVRTGDVVHLSAEALDARGRVVDGVHVTYVLAGRPEPSAVAQFPAAEVDDHGRFVAYKGGEFTVVAIGPGQVARRTILVTPRDVTQRIELLGQGAVNDKHTSDLWVWEGVDGRDYALTGTWGAGGQAYFWDVTDPSSPSLIDSVVVDARTVNDVKVSEDGRICVISREGASNRRNGLVILDCSNPRDVQILATFDDGLTGGVHNVFVYRNHVYAVNNGRKYDVISIEDPRNPRRVGVFELDTPGHGVHDVWIVDGIAYSSNWADGTVMVDVGNGIAGGSPSHPVEIGRIQAYGGRNHAAFPYRSPTGRTYVFMGDEIFPYGLNVAGGSTPNRAAGYIHIIDVTDPEHPEEVARYEVPEAGSHNFWIEDDKLYAAFYNGGLRVVDIAGELKGNLYYQGREIAQFIPYDPNGYVANAPFTWASQPHKGYIFFSDWNSGLWAVQLNPPTLTP